MTIGAYDILEKVRAEKPLVHHLTNWVTIYDCANIVKVFGASPVMAHAPEEVADMAGIASALVLNIGTLTSELVDSMKIAANSANKKGIPVVLDVCGAGATAFRDRKSLELLNEVKIDVIKGNASEVARIAGEDVRTKGVDGGAVGRDLVEVAMELARDRECTVAITGEEDIVTDGRGTYLVRNGHGMMACIVGTGCMAASVIGTFCAVDADLARAAAAGLCCFEIAAELAAEGGPGPGTFKTKLFDCVHGLNRSQIEARQKIEVR
ncbi:MAG: hydroxyethylthiazole kinase [Candidatus Coatesbacteria bacterium]|nr:hydroxyethylthiazole kinase [Candidatus Coatesbacteria bacterium]